ncbi:MAG: quinone-dependent dihydroorotate dehydrogenase [Cyanobacteria bacterium J055]|nr:MAG: quinone-dependent dihydroorotate dehydrogenase [Cyanobacteria bacterium J055]
MDIYQTVVRPILFSGANVDPEWLHRRTIEVLARLARSGDRAIGRWGKSRLQATFGCQDDRLKQQLWGLTFPHPVGLAAGFDKNGEAAGIWSSLGFGFAELGTVTRHAQSGNPKPRLFRLTSDRAALNRMGFNNCGADGMAANLASVKPEFSPRIPLGINLGKSKVTPLEEAAEDYRFSFKTLYEWGDYFVVNVSSPNTPGLRSLQAPQQLAPILEGLQAENRLGKPILVKIAPDLDEEGITAVVDLARTYHLAGMIATNTTIGREGLKTQMLPATGKPIAEEAGGISGAPVRSRSTQIIRSIWQQTGGELPIIGVGGIFTAEDAWEKITAGASLVQVYTGWTYEGPWMVQRILQGLLQKLEQHGLSDLTEAVGLSHRK